MKKISIAIVAAMVTISVYGQQKTIDSLKTALSNTKEDTLKVNTLTKLARYYSYSKPDSALLVIQRILALSRKLNFSKGEAAGLNLKGIVFLSTGNHPKALSHFLEAMKINEKINDRLAIAKNLGNIANIYSAQGDIRKNIVFLLRAKAILEELKNEDVLLVALTNLGASYMELNILDSARYYTNRGYELGIKYKDVINMGYNTANLGFIYSKMKNTNIAMDYFRTSLAYQKQGGNDEAVADDMIEIARLLNTSGKLDSARYYALKSMEIAKNGGFTGTVLRASEFLTSYFKKQGRLDSAFRYQELYITAKDSLFSQEKTKEVNTLSFAESQRQLEIAEQKRLDEITTKKNLQKAGIAIFLPTVFLILLFLSRLKIRPRTVDFLGMLVLLLTFEFISMLIFPYVALIEKQANGSPLVALPLRIGLAALLLPVYKRIERWAKGKLVNSYRKNQLDQAA